MSSCLKVSKGILMDFYMKFQAVIASIYLNQNLHRLTCQNISNIGKLESAFKIEFSKILHPRPTESLIISQLSVCPFVCRYVSSKFFPGMSN